MKGNKAQSRSTQYNNKARGYNVWLSVEVESNESVYRERGEIKSYIFPTGYQDTAQL